MVFKDNSSSLYSSDALNPKQIDNATQRIKNKVKVILEQREE